MEEKINQLILTYPHKTQLLEKMKNSLLLLENDFVAQDFVKELENVLVEQDEKKLIMLENMLRRMKVIHEESLRSVNTKKSYSLQICLFIFLILGALAFFMLLK